MGCEVWMIQLIDDTGKAARQAFGENVLSIKGQVC